MIKAWNIVHLPARVLSPAAEAFRYAVLENAETYLRAHDSDLLGAAADTAPRRLKPKQAASSIRKKSR